jgi:thiol:disulfide interchange protein DsbA
MNRFSFLIVFVAFFVVACGGGEQQAVEDPTVNDVQEEAVADIPAEETAEEPATPDAQPQMVEESAAEEEAVEEEDKPIILAQAEVPEPPAEWKFSEGTHYQRMVPTQPTVGGADKVEVAEIFWYGCNHCYDFEPFINRWAETIPANVRFVRIPAMWNPLVKLHAQLYYTEEVLVSNGKIANPEQFRTAVFAEYHRRQNRLASLDAIQALFEKHGVSEADFQSTWGSFEVSQKMRVGEDLGRRYAITGVPTVVVNGKYRTGAGEAGSYPRLLEMIDELILRESIR